MILARIVSSCIFITLCINLVQFKICTFLSLLFFVSEVEIYMCIDFFFQQTPFYKNKHDLTDVLYLIDELL